jgi:SAM-dependent methyltransferase
MKLKNSHHHFNLENGGYVKGQGIYINPGVQSDFAYSDGENFEKSLLESLQNSKDLSVSSEELQKHIRDWPSHYHLSPKRADLLRPLSEQLKGKKILEIGSGCGAITRFLGELGCNVLALEGSHKRALITAERCRDLKNVTIVNDNFNNFSVDEKFDFVTLIGVLEYSNVFIEGQCPPSIMLKLAKDLLKDEGQLIIAIENKLGLKYWAGAPEDHVGKSFFGIENKYSTKTPVTFGRKEITDLLTKEKFLIDSILFPFPDYKLPNYIVTEKGFTNSKFKVVDLLIDSYEYFQDKPYVSNFSTVGAADTLQKNSQLIDFANSFLIIASLREKENTGEILAYGYNTIRKKEFCKESIFKTDDNNAIQVIRRNIYGEKVQENGKLNQCLKNEQYEEGNILLREAIEIVSKDDWLPADLVPWAKRYYAILNKLSIESGSTLKGHFLDATPFNIIIRFDNSPFLFDLEWVANEDLPINFIFLRGLIHTFNKINCYKLHAKLKNPFNTTDLAYEIAKKVINVTAEEMENYISKDRELLNYVLPVKNALFSKTIGFLKSNEIDEWMMPAKMRPLNRLFSQLFWQKEKEEYNEENSVQQYIDLMSVSNTYIWSTKQKSRSINRFRFDPCCEPGGFYIESITIRNFDQIFYKWTRADNFFPAVSDILFSKSTIYKDKMFVLSLSSDPIIYIPPIPITNNETNDIQFEVTMSSLTEDELTEEIASINNHSEEFADQMRINNQLSLAIENSISNSNFLKKEIDRVNNISQNNSEDLQNIEKEIRTILSIQIKEIHEKVDKINNEWKESIGQADKNNEELKQRIENILETQIEQEQKKKKIDECFVEIRQLIKEGNLRFETSQAKQKDELFNWMQRTSFLETLIAQRENDITNQSKLMHEMSNKLEELKTQIDNFSLWRFFKKSKKRS